MMIQRYNVVEYNEYHERDDGDWVAYDDYAALEAKLQRLAKQVIFSPCDWRTEEMAREILGL